MSDPFAFDWSHAPEWANWYTVDSDGVGYWHEDKPTIFQPYPNPHRVWEFRPVGQNERCFPPIPPFHECVQHRPEATMTDAAELTKRDLLNRLHVAEALRSERDAAREQLAAVPWESLRNARHIASWHLWPPTRAAAEWFDASAPPASC